MGDESSFFGLKVPDGTDRRELYKSQYRGIWTYKMSASELDEAFRTAVTGDGPDGGWSIKNDERVKYVGKLELAKGEDQTLKVRDPPSHTHPITHRQHDASVNLDFASPRTRCLAPSCGRARACSFANGCRRRDTSPSLPPSLAPLAPSPPPSLPPTSTPWATEDDAIAQRDAQPRLSPHRH